MKIDLTNLANNQQQLDNYIFKKNNLNAKNTFDDRLMALLVEIGETANEVRFFKFWSQKAPSDKKVILEEFIDILHFVISLGLTINYKNWKVDFDNEITLNIAFFNLFKNSLSFKEKPSTHEFENLLISLLTTADSLDFSAKDIFEMYDEKNKINFNRQNNNY